MDAAVAPAYGSPASSRQSRNVCWAGLNQSASGRLAQKTVNEGAKVSYEEKENRGKTSAENLRVG
ncbi:hypothetical protein [Tardiphaga sp. 839_C3_N1_4]|uniref:hypothetical protein n=1 Tax=Tardiphaga sp. 839_C3_N1_4 TaxID=3240761 RepID=UPI003F221BF7